MDESFAQQAVKRLGGISNSETKENHQRTPIHSFLLTRIAAHAYSFSTLEVNYVCWLYEVSL